MQLLIIEDDYQKAERIKAALSNIEKVKKIEVCRSYQSGLRRLQESVATFDLVILDMSLPTFDPAPDVRQGRPRPLGGYEIMRKLKRQNIHPRVVVLTALENFGSGVDQISFEELARKCSVEFEDIFIQAIQYSQSSASWQATLKELVEEARN